jgi:hypothetical protein
MKSVLWVISASIAIGSVAEASDFSLPEHRIRLQLEMTEEGKVKRCAIVEASSQPQSDDAICSAFETYGFVPSGIPFPRKIETSFRWKGDGHLLDRSYQPDDSRLLLRPSNKQPWLATDDYPAEILKGQSSRIEVRYRVVSNGRVEKCRGKEPNANADLTAWTCKILSDRRVFKAVRDHDGNLGYYDSRSVFFWTPSNTRVCDEGDACIEDQSLSPVVGLK